MKRVSMELSEFDLRYICKVLQQDFLYCKSALAEGSYADDDEKLLLLFCKKQSKILLDKISSFFEEKKDV